MKYLNNFGISGYRYIVISVFFICGSASFAQDAFDAANAAYADGRYEEAAAMYQSLLDEQPDATLYYNLGNTRFKRKTRELFVRTLTVFFKNNRQKDRVCEAVRYVIASAQGMSYSVDVADVFS